MNAVHLEVSNSGKLTCPEVQYFTEGHSYEKIMDLLATEHNISLSLGPLQRRLDAGLTRRTNYSPIATVREAISEELKRSGQLLGYQAMWQTLKQKYCLVVRRNDVMCLMGEQDPCRIENRSRRRFVWRVYHSVGPNIVSRVDGYDKLKPFGFAIIGSIGGFSRKVLWLKCGKSNNDPEVTGRNDLKCVSEFGVIPMRLCTDCGIENGLMAALHCSLKSEHWNEFAGATCMALQHPTKQLVVLLSQTKVFVSYCWFFIDLCFI